MSNTTAHTRKGTTEVWVEDLRGNVIERMHAEVDTVQAKGAALNAAGYIRYSDWLCEGVYRAAVVRKQ